MASAGTAWRIAQLRPGAKPIAALARALSADGVLFRDFRAEGLALEDIVETNLRMTRLGLVDACAQARLPAGTNLLVVVDQFEELFRYRGAASGAAPDEASAFVDLLLEACRQTRHPIHVVLTMRSDFLGDCARLPGLAEAINAGQYLVPRMSRDERRRAITGPVAVAGAAILPVLLTRLLNDLGDDPDRLSILQHALNRIWAARAAEGGEGPLNLRHYSAIGSMANALERHLEQAYAELDEGPPREIARKLFRALTDTSTDPRGVRRPTAFGDLSALCEASPAALGAVIDVFRAPGRSFLMPPADEPLEPRTVIDISHESLMRRWGRLRDWADEEARSAGTYRRLAETAALHARGETGPWRDPELALALAWRREDGPNAAWAARYGAGFERAMAFLETSAAVRETERRDARENAARERALERAHAVADEQSARIAAQAKAAKVQRTVTRVIAGALVVSSALAALAGVQTWSRVQADRERVAAEVAEAETARAYAESRVLASRLAADTAAAEASREAADAETARAQNASRLIATRLLGDQMKLGANERTVETLSRIVAEDGIKARALWRLAERGGLGLRQTPVTTGFVNPRGTAVRILTWRSDATERPLAVVKPGEAAPLELFENDLWVARIVATGRLVDAGVADGAAEVVLPD